MPYIQVRDEKLFYAVNCDERSGPGKLAVVLIHGAGGSHLVWPAQLRQLAGTAVYALDLPAHGKSEGLGRAFIGEYADVVIGFLNALKIDAAVWVGHSMGGAIAQQIALDYWPRVVGLVLIATGARLRVAPAILEGLLADYDSALDTLNGYAWGPCTSDAMKRRGRQHLAQANPTVAHGDYAACNAFDVLERLGQIAAPTLIISGTADQLTPARYAAQLAKGIRGAQLCLIENAGHMVMLEQPDSVAETLNEFLQKCVCVGAISPCDSNVSLGGVACSPGGQRLTEQLR